jgi:DNA ligase (NAD+)
MEKEGVKLTPHAAKILNAKLYEASNTYHNHGKSNLSDEVYDQLFHQLKEYVETTDWTIVNPIDFFDPITTRVGAPISSNLPKIKHEEQLLSLKNVFSIADIKNELNRSRVIILNPKLDGIAISLTYRDGKLIQAVTRGDGEEGENIFHTVSLILSIPRLLPFEANLNVRGEMVITKHAFKKINEYRLANGEPVYANSRNAVSGILRMLNPDMGLLKHLSFFAYSIADSFIDQDTQEWFISNESEPGITVENVLRRLPLLGFSVKRFKIIKPGDEDKIETFINDMTLLRPDYDIDIDGIVAQYSSFELRKDMGHSSNYPHYAVAYKFPAETGVAILEGVEWQVGRTGVLTPVAHIDGVRLAGVEITSITLHNFAEIKRLGLKINDSVVVSRQGDVIPKILNNIIDLRVDGEYYPEINPPQECPVCSAKTTMSDDGTFIYCPNSMSCGGRLRTSIEHFASRDAMDIRGLGYGYIKFLVEAGHLTKISDVYKLHEYKGRLYQLDGFGKLSIDKLLDSIEKSKTTDLHRFIYGLGIPMVGLGTSKLISTAFRSLEVISKVNVESYLDIDGIGEITANAIVDYFSVEENQEIISEMIASGVNFHQVKSAELLPLKGQTYVFTGSFNLRGRDQWERLAESLGAKISGSVSAKTTALVQGIGGGSKAAKANALNIPIYQEDYFANLLNPHIGKIN